jgi:thiol:disulfide interchange protein DsbD
MKKQVHPVVVVLTLVAVILVTAGVLTGYKARRHTVPTAVSKVDGGGEKIAWVATFGQAAKQAKQEGKPLLVDVMASWCSACKRLDREVWSRDDVAAVSKQFVAVKVDGDLHPELPAKFAVSGYPTVLFLHPDGTEISRVRGPAPYEDMLTEMKNALAASAAKAK